MKNVKYIIKEAKKNTNSTDKEAIEDEICINLLNRSLRYLIATLYNLNVRTKLFRKEQEYNPYSWVNPIFDLPEDIYAKNAIISLRVGKYRDWETDRKSTRLNSSHSAKSRMPSSA